jgi:hypothetical protein
MRLLAGLAIAFGCCLGGAAFAQTALQAQPILIAPSNAGFGEQPSNSAPAYGPMGALLSSDTYSRSQGLSHWDSTETPLPTSGSAVNSVRISTIRSSPAPGIVPLNLNHDALDTRVYDVSVNRAWPGAVSFDTGKLGIEVTPHAGVGMGTAGGSAEAGATLTVGQKLDNDVQSRLKSMGVQDGAIFGNEGRWYLFAAASGRAVGLNIRHGEDGWDRAGWSTDPSSALIGDAQVGVGWRRGVMQTSFGYIHREVKSQHMLMGQETRADSVVAFSLSIKPRR